MKKLFIVLTILGCFIMSGCANKSESPKNAVLNLHLGADPSILNPILTSDSASSSVVGLVFTGLFRVNAQLKMEPDLAKSYTVSPDGLTYVFHLRRDVKWHDGKPFTADDVIFTFQKILDPKTNTVRRSDYVMDGVPVKFEKLDTYTVQITLPKPFAQVGELFCERYVQVW